MKLKALILTAIAAVAFALTPVTALAHEVVLEDSANLVEKEEAWEEIDDALWATVIAHEVGVWVHTTETLNGMEIAEYADEWHETAGSGDDGILLVVSMENRNYYIKPYGSCTSAFTDSGIDYIEEQIVPDMSEGDYEGAFITFARLCDDYLEQAKKGSPYSSSNMPKGSFDFVKSLLIAIVVGLVAGGIGLFLLFSNLKSVRQKNNASDYVKPGSFHLEINRNIYLYKKVKREEKPDENNKGSVGSGNNNGGSGGSF